MDWSHILETFIGAAFAFLFALILQCLVVWWQHRFQKKMQKDQQDFQERMERERRFEEKHPERSLADLLIPSKDSK
jgi:sensor domain CHASE-containing protein